MTTPISHDGLKQTLQAEVDAISQIDAELPIEAMSIDQLLAESARLHAIGRDETRSYPERDAAFARGFACAREAYYRQAEE